MASPPNEGGLDFQYALSDEREPPSRKEIAAAIVVVCLILAFLLFWLRRQSEQARTLNCAANLQQIGEAMLIYAQDNDETFPNRLIGFPKDAPWNQQEGYTWRTAIRPYLKTGKAYICLSNPMNQVPSGCTASPCGQPQFPDGFYVSYACNFVGPALSGGGSRGFCADKNEAGRKLASISSSTNMIAIVEDESTWSEFDVLAPSYKNSIFTGHLGAANYLFVDGHVSELTPAATLSNDSSGNDWTADGREFTPDESARAHKILGVGQ